MMHATYRLQFRQGVDFDTAAKLVPYIARLGVSHLYASPIFHAAEGSTHGYDVVDPNELDPVLGGEEGFNRLHRALKEHDLGLIIDIVPNHMSVGETNGWWWDALARGEDSPHAGFFDIDWQANEGRGRITMPILGAPYAEDLQNGNLKLVEENGRFRLAYFDRRFPLSPESREGLDAARVEALNGDFEKLHAFLERQNYRLVHWRAAPDSRNWRRFFDIDELIGVRVNDPDVFKATHELTLDLVRTGMVDGLRIDHVDGLAAPTTYLRRLRQAVEEAGAPPDFPIYVEKILGEGEELLSNWPVSGTTGYEVLNEISGLLVDPAAPEALTAIGAELTGDETPFEEVLRNAKAEVLDFLFAGELEGLTQFLTDLASRDIATAEIGAVRSRRAIAQLLVALPVYRVYPEKGPVSTAEKAMLEAAADVAKAGLDAGDHLALDLVVRITSDPQDADELEFAQRLQQLSGPVMAKSLEDTACYRSVSVLLANEVGGHPPHLALTPDEFLAKARRRLETFPFTLVPTATHDTKRGADTRARLIALAEDHEAWHDSARNWFDANATLRGEADEKPAPDPVTEYLFYQSAAAAWPPQLQPDDRDGLKDYAGRLTEYMIKAVREAKLQTKWTAPNEAFEGALRDFIARSLEPGSSNAFLPALHSYVERINPAAIVNSLSQTVLQAVVPGVPDVYQGSEAYDFSLVDPDNRRLPDFEALSRDMPESAEGLIETWRDGRVKQFVTHRVLSLRAAMPDLFLAGKVERLDVSGPAAGHLLALVRRHGGNGVVALVPLRPGRLLGPANEPKLPKAALQDTTVSLPEGTRRVTDRLGNKTAESYELDVSVWLEDLPVALLELDA